MTKYEHLPNMHWIRAAFNIMYKFPIPLWQLNSISQIWSFYFQFEVLLLLFLVIYLLLFIQLLLWVFNGIVLCSCYCCYCSVQLLADILFSCWTKTIEADGKRLLKKGRKKETVGNLRVVANLKRVCTKNKKK